MSDPAHDKAIAERHLAEIRRRAEEGDQGCLDWLEHQKAKAELRGLAEFIRREAEGA